VRILTFDLRSRSMKINIKNGDIIFLHIVDVLNIFAVTAKL